MNQIILRKAKADYVCNVCGHIIKKDEVYIDNCIFNVGKIVQHERYHDECPHASDASKLFARIEHENGDLICADSEGCKVHVIGIVWSDKGPMFLYKEWASNEVKTLPIECAYVFVDANGGSIV